MSGRPRLRPDLVLVEQTYRGEQSFIVKDPQTHKYFRFRPVEVMVMHALDGAHSPGEVAEGLSAQGLRLSAAAVEGFARKLTTMGLCERTLQERSVLQLERLRAQRRHRLTSPAVKGDIFRLRWSVGDPDRFMERCMPYLKPLFSRGFILFSLGVFAIYFLILGARWNEFASTLAQFYRFDLSGDQLLVFWLTGIVIIVIHELGHGFACKYFGGKVHEIGAMLIYFEPAFYCNVNDAWTFPDRSARLWVTAAGSWIQLVLAGLAAVVWWAATPGTLVEQIALGAVIFGGITTVFFNINPLIPLDGYYALSDYLEVANLRQRAFAHLKWLAKTRLLRLEAPMPPADEREQRIFLYYGTLAAGYITTIFLAIGGLVYGWMEGLLGGLGIALFLVGLWMVLRARLRSGWQTVVPAWRRFRASAGAGWLGGPRRYALAIGILVLVGVLVPRSITMTGRFAAAPVVRAQLTAPDSGVVDRVYVGEGTRVVAGTPLLEIRDLDLERLLVTTRRRADSLAARLAVARARSAPAELARLESARAIETARLTGLEQERAALTLRAVTGGVVMTPRPHELVGRWVGLGDPLLELGEPGALEARVALMGAGATQVQPGQLVRLIFHADGAGAARATVTSVAAAASAGGSGAVEARVALDRTGGRHAGMTGEASVSLRRSNLWGALWWAVRRRVRTDLLL